VQLDAPYSGIERYYTAKVSAHGTTPLGVDWASVPTQELRFVQLLKVCDFRAPISLNDIGCGYGALLGFLDQRVPGKVDYLGVDLSPRMIDEARRLWAGHTQAAFAVGNAPPRTADYSVASGIFNVKLSQPTELWAQLVRTVLHDMHASSRRGFAVNFLAPLEAGLGGAPELYRPAPGVWQEYCERTFDAGVEVLAGYGMREYTLLVRPG
jgi:SAM-dependent methyltransferase